MPTCKIEGAELEEMTLMSDMKPLQWGIIEGSIGEYDGTVVMRTANAERVEIINLTAFKPDRYWNGGGSLKVKLGKGKLKLTIEN